jgi:glycosyltransferase involved in cell wall biosynthesis
VREGFIEKKDQMVEVIPFSLFETYNFSTDQECYKIGKNAVTIIGIIRPYKGIQLFIEAINILIDKKIEITPVIAGKGDLSQYSFKYKDHYYIVNQTMSDSQFCEIIKKSTIVVCPYLSASQSGIPMVAYLFNKPVVATNVGALPEYISDKRMLVDLNAEHLAFTIERLLTNASFYNETITIQNETYLITNTWEKIARKTIQFYNAKNNY